MNEWMNECVQDILLSLVKITFITWHLPVCCVDKSKNDCFVKYVSSISLGLNVPFSFFFPSFHFPSLFINFGQQEVCKKIITWLSLPPMLTSLWESSFLTFVAGVIALHSYFNLQKLRVWAENVAVTDVPLNEGDNKFKSVVFNWEIYAGSNKLGRIVVWRTQLLFRCSRLQNHTKLQIPWLIYSHIDSIAVLSWVKN